MLGGKVRLFGTTKKTQKHDIQTSLTLKYRKEAWGIDRIVLDTVSNHLPGDSKGTIANVQFQQENKLVDFRSYDPTKPVQSIIVSDDGKGFDYGLLNVLFSTKNQETNVVGQFGEGMKMVSAACLRADLPIKFSSRKWEAVPYSKSEIIDGNPIDRLCFSVDEDTNEKTGSTTTFDSPSQELIDEFAALQDNVLFFNNNYEVLLNDGYFRSRIIDLKNDKKGVFVKGIRIKKGLGYGTDLSFYGMSLSNQLFSYDLAINNISPDRQIADRDAALVVINGMLSRCSNENVLDTILTEASQNPEKNFLEYDALHEKIRKEQERKRMNDPYGFGDNFGFIKYRNKDGIDYGKSSIFNIKMASLDELVKADPWVKAFYKKFGELAVLKSDTLDRDEDARYLGYNVVKLHPKVESFLKSRGVKTSKDLFNREEKYVWVQPSELTEEEKSVLEVIPKINRVLLGNDLPVNLRVYSGRFSVVSSNMESHNPLSKIDQELHSDSGFYNNKDPDNESIDIIGIRRSQLKDVGEFAKTYIHELGHKVTGRGDYEREFTDWFVSALSKYVIASMSDQK